MFLTAATSVSISGMFHYIGSTPLQLAIAAVFACILSFSFVKVEEIKAFVKVKELTAQGEYRTINIKVVLRHIIVIFGMALAASLASTCRLITNIKSDLPLKGKVENDLPSHPKTKNAVTLKRSALPVLPNGKKNTWFR